MPWPNSNDEWERAVDGCAERLLDAGRIAGPPVDALTLAARLGFVIATDTRLQGRARYAQLHGPERQTTATIFLRPEPRAERRHWAVAHEIGERHAHELFAALDLDADAAPPSFREQAANALANRLLLPSAWFYSDGEACDWDLSLLKQRYSTASYELIARRMLEADAPAVITIFDHGVLGFRRGPNGARAPGPSVVEFDAWRHAHSTGRFHEHRDRGYSVRVWPIHEPGWKREIVRTEPTMRDLTIGPEIRCDEYDIAAVDDDLQ